jgi:hypothetical protein
MVKNNQSFALAGCFVVVIIVAIILIVVFSKKKDGFRGGGGGFHGGSIGAGSLHGGFGGPADGGRLGPHPGPDPKFGPERINGPARRPGWRRGYYLGPGAAALWANGYGGVAGDYYDDADYYDDGGYDGDS